MFADKPVIGIAGGIGSGKSTIARLFGERGCFVINSDEQVNAAYRDANVKQTIKHWWGEKAIDPAGLVDRKFIASKVFDDPAERRRLEALLHPLIDIARRESMSAAIDKNPKIPAFVWDAPLLFEAGLNLQCDAVVFVDAPPQERLARVRQTRNWDEAELARREKSQWPLDKKREISDYVIRNTADVGFARGQVEDVLSRILLTKGMRG